MYHKHSTKPYKYPCPPWLLHRCEEVNQKNIFSNCQFNVSRELQDEFARRLCKPRELLAFGGCNFGLPCSCCNDNNTFKNCKMKCIPRGNLYLRSRAPVECPPFSEDEPSIHSQSTKSSIKVVKEKSTYFKNKRQQVNKLINKISLGKLGDNKECATNDHSLYGISSAVGSPLQGTSIGVSEITSPIHIDQDGGVTINPFTKSNIPLAVNIFANAKESNYPIGIRTGDRQLKSAKDYESPGFIRPKTKEKRKLSNTGIKGKKNNLGDGDKTGQVSDRKQKKQAKDNKTGKPSNPNSKEHFPINFRPYIERHSSAEVVTDSGSDQSMTATEKNNANAKNSKPGLKPNIGKSKTRLSDNN